MTAMYTPPPVVALSNDNRAVTSALDCDTDDKDAVRPPPAFSDTRPTPPDTE
jgi:hypothetical protein